MTFNEFCENHCIYRHQDKRNEEPCINCPAEAWADKMEGEGEQSPSIVVGYNFKKMRAEEGKE